MTNIAESPESIARKAAKAEFRAAAPPRPTGLVISPVQIKAYFTADEWELYDSWSFRFSDAIELNMELERLVNVLKCNKKETRRLMHSTMADISKSGAYDTEPRAKLESILNQIFGEDE